MSNSPKSKTIGDLVPIGIKIEEFQYLVYVGSYGIEYLIDTVRECLNKVKETDPEFVEAKFAELSDKLFGGCAEGEGCFLKSPIIPKE